MFLLLFTLMHSLFMDPFGDFLGRGNLLPVCRNVSPVTQKSTRIWPHPCFFVAFPCFLDFGDLLGWGKLGFRPKTFSCNAAQWEGTRI